MDCLKINLNLLLKEKIYFGQLLGMKDYISLIISQEGFKSFKYIPYGEVGETIPYLIRRVQENNGLLKNSDCDVLGFVLWKRLFSI